MLIGIPESMKEAVKSHFNQAGHGFEPVGASTSAFTTSGHRISMYRSMQLPDMVLAGNLDVALFGTDVQEESRQKYKALRQKPEGYHYLATFPDYGRQLQAPLLDVVVPYEAYQNGVRGFRESMIVATEHVFTVRKLLIDEGFRPVALGANGWPLNHREFRKKVQEHNATRLENDKIRNKKPVIGIYKIDGKVPSVLNDGGADIGTIVTESGVTNNDNTLVEVRTIGGPIHMLLIGNAEFVAKNHAEAHNLARELLDAYAKSKTEFLKFLQEGSVTNNSLLGEEFLMGSPERY